MMKFLFALLLSSHGLIHLLGFSKAFGFVKITQLVKPIPRTWGLLWLITTIVLLLSALLDLLKKESWTYLAATGIILSQNLLFTTWKDARFGTIANLIIVLILIAYWGNQSFESKFIRDVKKNLEANSTLNQDLLTENDILQLPPTVQKYLRYYGVINKPKPENVHIDFEGEKREKGENWFPFKSIQHNFTREPSRLFFMKARMFGLTVPGYHNYEKGKAGIK